MKDLDALRRELTIAAEIAADNGYEVLRIAHKNGVSSFYESETRRIAYELVTRELMGASDDVAAVANLLDSHRLAARLSDMSRLLNFKVDGALLTIQEVSELLEEDRTGYVVENAGLTQAGEAQIRKIRKRETDV